MKSTKLDFLIVSKTCILTLHKSQNLSDDLNVFDSVFNLSAIYIQQSFALLYFCKYNYTCMHINLYILYTFTPGT